MVRQVVEAELASFEQFVYRRLGENRSVDSLDSLFEEWRHRHPTTMESVDRAAIAASVNDLLSGEQGRPAGELSLALRESLHTE